MKMFKVAILAIFILFYAKVNSQDTSDTLEVELSVNATVSNDQNSTEEFYEYIFNEVRELWKNKKYRIYSKTTRTRI